MKHLLMAATVMIGLGSTAFADGINFNDDPVALEQLKKSATIGNPWKTDNEKMTPQVKDAMQQKYYMGGNPNQWMFIMGPTDSDKQFVRLMTPYPAGKIAFGCDYSGNESAAISIAGVKKPRGWKGLARIELNGTARNAKIISEGILHNQVKTTFDFIDPNEVAGLIDAMATSSQGRAALSKDIPQVLDHDYIYLNVTIGDNTVKIPIPPTGFAENASKFCMRWYNDNFLKSHGFTAPDDKTAPSDSVPHTGIHFSGN